MGPFDFVSDIFSGSSGGFDPSDLVTSAIDYTFQSKQASRSRAFSRDMDNTKYQRAVDDLRQAGLNPILAATKGITTGSGASAPGAPSGGSLAQNRQASAAKQQAATARQLMKEQLNNIKQDTKLKKDQASQAWQAAHREMYHSAKLQSEADLINVEAILKRFDIPGRRFEESMDKDARGEMSRLMKRYPIMGQILNSIGLGAGALGVYSYKNKDKKPTNDSKLKRKNKKRY